MFTLSMRVFAASLVAASIFTDGGNANATTKNPATADRRLSEVAGNTASKGKEKENIGRTRPNVLLVVVDDMGWKDVGFHDPSFSTPHLDTLADEGVELATFYTSPTCTPSRAQLMTGRYNFRTGMQDSVLHSTEPRGVPLTETFLGEKLQAAGYSTAMVGKWHLGMHMPQYLPQERGFDQYYGILTGGGGHYSHMSVSQDFTPRGDLSQTRSFTGPNIVEGTELSPDSHGAVHSTELYSNKAAQYITAMAQKEDPWFLYLSYQAIHDPIETDDVWTTGNACESISQETSNGSGAGNDETDWDNRKIVCGMVAQVDHGVGKLRSVLENLGEWDNTVIVFFSDNGGLASHGSNNHPFRGGKGDYWEGGVHVPAFMSGGFVSGALEHNNVDAYRYGHLTHITDVHATVLGLAGYADGGSDALDGFDLWHSLTATKQPVREAVVINLNSPNFARSGAVRWGKYKLIRNPEPSETAIYSRVKVKLANERLVVTESVLQEATAAVHSQLHLSEPRMYLFDLEANPSETISEDCGKTHDAGRPTECANLYTITAYKDIRRKLEGILQRAQDESVLPTMRWMDDGPLADPLSFGGWVPWRDVEGDPLANYAGVIFEEPESSGHTAGNGDNESGSRNSDEVERLEAVSLAGTGGLADGTIHQVGGTVGFILSPGYASGLAIGVSLVAVGASFLGYRAGRRSGYYGLVR